jgi:hypothetical protein
MAFNHSDSTTARQTRTQGAPLRNDRFSDEKPSVVAKDLAWSRKYYFTNAPTTRVNGMK